mgnify:CR=1 FL=1
MLIRIVNGKSRFQRLAHSSRALRSLLAVARMFTAITVAMMTIYAKKCDEKFHHKNVFTQFAHSKEVNDEISVMRVAEEEHKEDRDDRRPGQFS